jgi:hypothetical protein
MAKVLMSVTIDTECDKSPDWSNSNPLSFKSILEGVPDKLQPLFKTYGIKPTYFLSPEVIRDKDSASIFHSIQKECELGTHLHADFIEPMKTANNFDGLHSHAFQTEFSPSIEFQKLDNLTSLFKSTFNFDPMVFRAGRYAANQHTIKSLIKLGYKVDSSFTPHLKWIGPNGSVINHETAPEQPYFTNEKDIYNENNGEILEIPISIIKTRKFFRTKHLWLRPKFSSFNEMKQVINSMQEKFSNYENIVLVMMFHSQEVIPNASPYTKTDLDVENYLKLLNMIFEYAQKNKIHFATLLEIYKLFNNTRK